MLSLPQLQQLRIAYQAAAPVAIQQALGQMGAPTDAEIVQSAVEYVSNPDRNVRVLMLRILAYHQGIESVQGILAGLGDSERRVRGVAVQSSVNFVHHPEIAEKLGQMAADTQEKRKISERALSTLLGVGAPVRRGPLPQAAANIIEPLIAQPDYRERILHGLVQIDACEAVEQLLRQFIDNGSPVEAAMTTKALSGYQMVNIGQFEEGPEREAILRDCELASGRVFYWVQR